MEFVTTHVVSAVGITLVHFLWQGAGIGLITAAVLATCPGSQAQTRYKIAGAGLATMTMAPLVTLGFVWPTAPVMGATAASMAAASVDTAADGFATSSALLRWLPAAVAVWSVGVGVLTTRLFVAWIRTERVRRRDVAVVSEGLASSVRRIADDLGIRRPVATYLSGKIDVPTVIGWIRPTLLLPIGAFTGLSVQQIEAVLAHELAHVKRHDYLINVLQNFAETVFFYHPAVWWVSRQVRLEREHCCDDVAVQRCGSPLLYARALTALEASRHSQATLALAATDGSLLGRVRRLLAPAQHERRVTSLPIAACVVVVLAVVAFGGLQARGAGAAAPVLPVPESTVTEGVAGGPVAQMETSLVERLDAGAIEVDGEIYRRGNADDMRLLRNTAQAQRDTTAAPTADGREVAPETPRGVVRIGGGLREPRKIRHVDPIYPEPAKAAGISGVVILEATIDTEGVPVGIAVMRSIPDLDQAAINAVRQWRYVPTLLNGQPVAVMMTFTVNFVLEPTQEHMETLERTLADLRARLSENPQDPVAQRQLEVAQMRHAVMTKQRETARATSLADIRERLAEQRPSAPAIAGAGSTAVRVGGDVREPRKIVNVNPVYPKAARDAQVSGVVIMEVLINETGEVVDARILRSIPMLDDAALNAVRQWRYEPTLVNGVPTPVRMTITTNFTLN
jgi:TonB family protein